MAAAPVDSAPTDVVGEDAQGRRLEVVELTAARGPHERADGGTDDDEGEGNDDEEYFHDYLRGFLNVRA